MQKTHFDGIDGLRAVSVTLVVLFHLGLPFVPGGYIGVDVFFVISGFLITGIIVKQQDQGTFAYSTFLLRRARRLLPALLAMCAYAALVSYLLHFPDELAEFAESLLSAILMLSNFYFMEAGGYFARPAESHILLHTWSLSVEAQFYLLFPVFLTFYMRRWKRNVGSFLCVAFLVALLFVIVVQIGNQQFGFPSGIWASAGGAFYFTPFRAYELLMGACLAMLKPGRWEIARAGLLTLTGLTLIVAAALLLDGSLYYPGVAALIPCVGAVLAILGLRNNAESMTSRVMTAAPILYLGRISYSLYLWHWPLIVTWGMLYPSSVGLQKAIVLLPIMLLASAASFHFLEEPIHRGRALADRGALVGALSLASAVVIVFSTVGVGTGGMPSRIRDEILQARAQSLDRSTIQFAECAPDAGFCVINGSSGRPPTFLLWGDSHAEAILPAVATAAEAVGASGIYIQRSGCVPLLGVWQQIPGYQEECRANSEAALDAVRQFTTIRSVLMASRWALYATGARYTGEHGSAVAITDADDETSSTPADVFRRGLERTSVQLQSEGKELFFVEQAPEMPWPVTDTWSRWRLLGLGGDLMEPRAAYDERNKGVDDLMQRNGISKIRIADQLCDKVVCYAATHGFPRYRDGNHLNTATAVAIAPAFEGVLRP